MKLTFNAVLFGLGIALVCCGLVWACNVPVYRFALERWRQDPYRAVLFHREPLTESDREVLNSLDDQVAAQHVNLTYRTVDVSKLDGASTENAGEDAALLASMGNPSFPSFVVQYPAHLKIEKPVWSGTLSRDATARVTDSAVRKELIRRLVAGQTAVWLLLESGQSAQDDSTAALLETELKKLEKELKLPELTTSPEDAILTDTPLQIAFSVIRVKRDSADEQALVGMLIHSEPDLAELPDPMVFPVFGRGRALLPLIGAGITAKNIYDSAAFLVGPCSCEVKEQNPGFDLLLTADWENLVSQSGISLAAGATPVQDPPAVAELVPIPTGASTAGSNTTLPPTASEAFQGTMASSARRPGVWLIAVGVLAGVILVTAIAVSLSRRTSQ